jgi:DivIVA domain-containing protein
MIDESFRLTPVDVRRRDFASKMRGYDPAQVEAFREEVARELENLVRANQELDAKVKNLVEQLRSFRERDKALNDALVSAQQLRSELREQSEREAQLMMRETRAEAERLMDGARAEVRRMEGELAQLERTRQSYISHLRAICERQLADLDAAEGAAPHWVPRDQAPPTADSPPRPAKKTPAWLDSLVKE